MTMNKILFISVFLFGLYANAQSIENIWKARGLEANDKVTELNKKRDTGKGLSALEKCRWDLEAAFAMLINPKSKTLEKVDENSFKLLLYFMNEKNKAVSINFMFQKDSKLPIGIGPRFFGKADDDDWMFFIMPNSPSGDFVLTDKSCRYIFESKDYLNPTVQTAK